MPIIFFVMLLAGAQTPIERQDCTPTSVKACSEDELLFLLSDDGINRFFPNVDPEGVRFQASRRVGTVKLLETLRASDDGSQREAIVRILSERDDSKEIASTFASLLNKDISRASCWMAEYLAHRGNQRALYLLNDHSGEWWLSSAEWASVVRVFGEQRFYPATPNLIESLGAASLNLGQAALEALMILYPGTKPSDIATIASAKAYFRARANAIKHDQR